MARPAKTNDGEKQKSVSVAGGDILASLRKELKGDMVEMGENFEYFLTGNPMLDAYMGSGGLPKYQLEYIWATTSVGKSTLAIQILVSYLKQATENKYIILYMDTEESVTPQRLKALGIEDVSKVNILNPASIERVGEIIKVMSEKYKGVELFVIWDTISQTPAQEELDGYSKIGMQARSLTSLFRTTKFYDSKLTMFALNQYRESNFEANAKYLPKEPPGGNSVKHKSFLTLFGTQKKSELIDASVGYVVTLNTRKSKIISPHRKMDFEFIHTSGYDAILTAINFLRSNKLLGKKNGGYFFFVDDEDTCWRLNDLYNWFLSDESIPKWKFIINEVFNLLYPDDDEIFVKEAKERIFSYYFKKDHVDITKFTSVNKKLIGKGDDLSSDKDLLSVIDTINSGFNEDSHDTNNTSEEE